jgi:hypothetical protein
MDKNFERMLGRTIRTGPKVHLIFMDLSLEHRIAARLAERLKRLDDLPVLVITDESVLVKGQPEILLGLDKIKVADKMKSR